MEMRQLSPKRYLHSKYIKFLKAYTDLKNKVLVTRIDKNN